MKNFGRVLLAVLVFVSLFLPEINAQATSFSDASFSSTWNRVDKAVLEIPNLGRGYTWGPPVAGSENIATEPYNTATRKVQYFDKSRMEINNPTGNPNDLFYVTNGLLVKELVTGYRQDGDNNFTPLLPSQTQIAGDPNEGGANQIAPTYASFKLITTFEGNGNGQAAAIGSNITSRIDRTGTISQFNPPVSVSNGSYDPITRHNIAAVFVTYGNQQGLVWNGSTYNQGSVFFNNPVYVLGRPVTEPLWTRAVVAGVEKDVLVQLFERRVLTYTPGNPKGFEVEMGNVGQHYYKWRYLLNREVPAIPTKVELVNQFGRDQVGLRGPTYITVDGQGNSFVADRNGRIQKYDNSGNPLQQFGGKGTADGQFDNLLGMAVDSQSNLYTVDSTEQRIQKFDNQGHFLLKWGSQGNSNGQFDYPRSVITDGQNNVYVLDNKRVQKFDTEGHFLGSWGSAGGADSQLNGTFRLALDEAGNFYVLDSTNENGKFLMTYVKKFDPQGHFLLKWSTGSFGAVASLVVDKQGNILVGLTRYDTSGHVIEYLDTKLGNPIPGEMLTVYQVAIDRQGNIYFADGNNSRVYKLDSQGKVMFTWSTYGRGDGQVREPGSLAVDGQGNVYVFDLMNYRVQKFDSQGQFLAKWGSYGSGDGQFKNDAGLGVDEQGNVYVADPENHRVQKFDSQGHFLLKWGSPPEGSANCQGTLAYPNGVAISSSGDVFVLDGQVKCIEKFDSQGHFKMQWSSLLGYGATLSPNRFTLDRQSNLYFADPGNNRIQKYDQYGKLLLEWGEFGTGNGQFIHPRSISTDNQGNVYVLDDRIQKFDSQGHFLYQWPPLQSLNNEKFLGAGLVVDGQGNLYITDPVQDRILKYHQS